MAWSTKFSGLPTLNSTPVGGDSYAAGIFTINAMITADRGWNGNSPFAYVDLATIGANISNVLRVTARYLQGGLAFGTIDGCGGGVALYGPGENYAALAWVEEQTPGSGSTIHSGAAQEGGTLQYLNQDFSTGGAPPHQFRLYWNDTAAAFIISDAGFGSHSVAAHTVSYWYSVDDGSTWLFHGDRAIHASFVPTRAAIFANVNIVFFDFSNDTIEMTNLEVMEAAEPVPSEKIQPEAIEGGTKKNEVFTASQVGTEQFALATEAQPSSDVPCGYLVWVYVNGVKQKYNAAPGARQFRMVGASTLEVGGLVIGDRIELRYRVS